MTTDDRSQVFLPLNLALVTQGNHCEKVRSSPAKDDPLGINGSGGRGRAVEAVSFEGALIKIFLPQDVSGLFVQTKRSPQKRGGPFFLLRASFPLGLFGRGLFVDRSQEKQFVPVDDGRAVSVSLEINIPKCGFLCPLRRNFSICRNAAPIHAPIPGPIGGRGTGNRKAKRREEQQFHTRMGRT